MPRIRLYRHPNCARCARLARFHHAFNWLGRYEDSTQTPPSGPLRMGEIVVEDLVTGRIAHGAQALDLLCRQIPLYTPLRPFLRLPTVRRYVDAELSGCDDGSCEISAGSGSTTA